MLNFVKLPTINIYSFLISSYIDDDDDDDDDDIYIYIYDLRITRIRPWNHVLESL